MKKKERELKSLKKEYHRLLNEILSPLSDDKRVDLALGKIELKDSRLERLGELKEKILELDPNWLRAIRERVGQMTEVEAIDIITGGRRCLNTLG